MLIDGDEAALAFAIAKSSSTGHEVFKPENDTVGALLEAVPPIRNEVIRNSGNLRRPRG